MKKIRALTRREVDELAEARKIAEETIRRIDAIQVFNADMSEMWELRNFAQQTSAILYNVASDIYSQGARS